MRLAITLAVLLLLVFPVTSGFTQTPTGVLRIRVRVKADDSAPLRGLARKRFYLMPGTLDQNRALIQSIDRQPIITDRKSTRLNSSHGYISYAVFCLKK